MNARSSSLVPLAGFRSKKSDLGAIAQIGKLLGESFIRRVEDAIEEDLDAKMARIRLFTNEVGVDPFGFDPEIARYALAVAALLHRLYFRTEVHDIDRVPQGRTLVIANHSGQVPIDGLILATALMLDAEPPRFARSMVEKWSASLPFVSVLFPRCGQIVGAPENARVLLEHDETLVVFPEGSRGISKTFDHRYRMTEFGLGFMRLALETYTPICPVAIVGAEEQLISVADIKPLAKVFGMPAFPIIPQLLFGAAFPLPTKYRMYFGEPIPFTGDPDDDDAIIEEKVLIVKHTIQTMIHRGLRERRAIFW